MTKNDIAMNINFTADYITRTIGVDSVDYKEGQIIIVDKAESWAYDNDSSFNIENTNYDYELVFTCRNIPCHKVDYDNEEEVEILNAVEGEGEVLIAAGTQFRVVSVSSADDYEEMGYCEVELEVVK